MAWSKIQSGTYSLGSASSGTFSKALANTTQGNLFVVGAAINKSSDFLTINLNGGTGVGSWTKLMDYNPSTQTAYFYYGYFTSNLTTPNLNFVVSGGTATIDACYFELSYGTPITSNPYDTSQFNGSSSGGSTFTSNASGTLAAATDVIIGAGTTSTSGGVPLNYNGSTSAWATNNQTDSNNTKGVDLIWGTVSTTAAVTANATANTGTPGWSLLVAAFSAPTKSHLLACAGAGS